MSSRRHIKCLGYALLSVGLATGCADGEIGSPDADAVPITAAIAVAPADAATGADSELAVTPTSGESEDAVGGAMEASVAKVEEGYSPPFPDRVDLFVAPKRQGASVASETGERAVELMGFIRVDRMRAILSINGEISPVAEGEIVGGVEVISVKPPSVMLQRGRQRWQVTIE